MRLRARVLPRRRPSRSLCGLPSAGSAQRRRPPGAAQVREAELMHGRQAMLATVGFVFPKLFGKLPVDWAKDISLNPLEAQYQIPPVALGQIAISIAIAEGLRSRIVFSNDPDYVVGDHGFGAGMLKGKSEAQVKDMKMKELAHCRLAMVAITGMFFQTAITGSLYPLVDKF
uniref:Light harvesting protein n=1 Tax=Emiliania huxleyi TaxID=2903 RepID=A0A6V2S9D8_EMIHU